MHLHLLPISLHPYQVRWGSRIEDIYKFQFIFFFLTEAHRLKIFGILNWWLIAYYFLSLLLCARWRHFSETFFMIFFCMNYLFFYELYFFNFFFFLFINDLLSFRLDIARMYVEAPPKFSLFRSLLLRSRWSVWQEKEVLICPHFGETQEEQEPTAQQVHHEQELSPLQCRFVVVVVDVVVVVTVVVMVVVVVVDDVILPDHSTSIFMFLGVIFYIGDHICCLANWYRDSG